MAAFQATAPAEVETADVKVVQRLLPADRAGIPRPFFQPIFSKHVNY